MITVVITEKGGAQRQLEFDKPEITIGRTKGNDIILPKGNVSKRHCRVVLKDGRFIVVDLKSTNGTYVNGRKITSPVVVRNEDKIYIGDFVLGLDSAANANPAVASSGIPPQAAPSHSGIPMAGADFGEPPPTGSVRPPLPPERPPASASMADSLPSISARPSTAPRSLAGREKKGRSSRLPWSRFTFDANYSKATDLNAALRLLMLQLRRSFDIDNTDPEAANNSARRTLAEQQIEDALRELDGQGLLDERIDREALAEAAFQEAIGLGPLESLLIDRQIQELLIKGPRHLFANYGNGPKRLESVVFSSSHALHTVAQRLFGQAGSRFQADKSIQQTRLVDGSQVTLWLRTIAPDGPIIRIRRARSAGVSADALVEQGILSEDMLELLKQALQQKCKVLVSGPPRSGVSMLMSALAGLVPRSDWLLSIESDVSLDLPRDQLIALSRGDAFDQHAAATILSRANQFHCDWLIVDDMLGAEAFDFLEYAVSKSIGGLFGIHASGVEDPLQVLATMAKFHARAPASINQLLAEVFGLIVEVDLDQTGKSFIRSIRELVGMRGDAIKLQELFLFQDGEFVSTGKEPKFLGIS